MPCNKLAMFESSKVTNSTLGRVLARHIKELAPLVVGFIQAQWPEKRVALFRVTPFTYAAVEINVGNHAVRLVANPEGFSAFMIKRRGLGLTDDEELLIEAVQDFAKVLAVRLMGDEIAAKLAQAGSVIEEEAAAGLRVLVAEIQEVRS